jgi:hypothetical protein
MPAVDGGFAVAQVAPLTIPPSHSLAARFFRDRVPVFVIGDTEWVIRHCAGCDYTITTGFRTEFDAYQRGAHDLRAAQRASGIRFEGGTVLLTERGSV